ncbi:glycogen/starch/alpha-glucan phosphorylase [Ruminococcus flavefaciens]|uniref:glycogen/starch/alpha-glucan phosphorylase n=1 Tax=Ruminococcus flavefaciens TaxID=1265 RepID=UPI0026EF3CE1|nr:glycogen/starch/alpha-glucan phosphorylase [Ruminococcus flavefaciens]MDD7515150.1 glycogen/starch/alpha-glucan phosphorylase [Ruminococcus flavefaciens]MDY5691575.1 glycogen/starch/alpha-glucan phosphorylase [Ruminococcus flavefaciens]
MDRNMFIEKFTEKLPKDIKSASPQQLHDALGRTVMEMFSDRWNNSRQAHLSKRRAAYLSMEFLVGRAVYNNLLVLGIYDDVEKAFAELGLDLASLEEIEDAALGNGGLGRLAACFLDSAASLSLPLDGYGIRYKYGLFKQSIVDGYQKEDIDDWTKYGDPWSVRCDEDTVLIEYNGQTVKAVPYDMPVFGFYTENVGTLRLWQAEPVKEFDFDIFNKQDYLEASKEKIYAEDISRVLYPNDDTDEGKKLRLKQQYFFSCASLTDIIRKHKARFGTLDNLADYISVQLNDTHPVISIPELIRQLVDNEGYTFETALAMAKKIFNYTNHTVMQEALEKWRTDLVEELLPRIYAIIIQINEALIADMYSADVPKDKIDRIKIIKGSLIHMADMACYASSHINGVAEIHTQILKDTVLADWFSLYPERFRNETNGITQRRWIALCNKELSALITELIGDNSWINDLDKLKELAKYADDENILRRFIDIKQDKKKQLSDFIKAHDDIDTDPNFVFDIQIKRLHEYKRQLLNAFSILWIYYGIKDGSISNFTPTAFIFGAKSAPGYRRAKAIIKFINEVGRIVSSDPDTRDLIKVVFVQNYNVSYAEKLVAGADISEQISTAGTEASGTGNMKLMLNGAVTLGTFDGANIEIVQEAGEENNYIFGARVEELEKIVPEYDSRKIFADDPMIRKVVSSLIDGSVSDGGSGDFRELYTALLDGASWHAPDHYYLLGDMRDYVETKLRCISDYSSDRMAFARKQWLNMCNAGKFSSDRTIADYAENIWNIR